MLSIFKRAAISAGAAFAAAFLVILTAAFVLVKVPDPGAAVPFAVYFAAIAAGAVLAALSLWLLAADGRGAVMLCAAISAALVIGVTAAVSVLSGGVAREGRSHFLVSYGILLITATAILAVRFIRPKVKRRLRGTPRSGTKMRRARRYSQGT